jgi:hypothetical protein
MRRALISATAILTLLLAATPAIAAGPPVREPYDPGTLTFGPGDVCSFALEIATEQNSAHQLVFPPNENGSVRIKVNGRYLTRVTNVDEPQQSMLLHAFGPATIVAHADGSTDLSTSGPSVLYFFPGDAIEGLWLANGRYKAHLSADNIITSATITGPRVDLCAALTP